MNRTIALTASLVLLLTAATVAAASTPQDTAPRTATVIGRIVDETGRPVGGATVELVRPANDTLPELLSEYLPGGPTVIATVETETSGRFAIDVEPGRALGLMARKGAEHLARPVADVVPGQPVTLQLLPAVEHRVRVVRATEDGVLEPVAGANVHVMVLPIRHDELVAYWYPWPAGWETAAVTGADGRVEVRAARGAPVMVRAFDAWAIASGEADPAGGEILLELGVADAHGIVVDTGGAPLANARVHFGPLGSGGRAQETAADGRFAVAADSLAFVFVECEGHGPSTAYTAFEEHEYSREAPGVVRMQDADRIRARLTTIAGEPLRNAPVLLQGSAVWHDDVRPFAAHARTDADGVLDRRCIGAESAVIGWVQCDGVWICFHFAQGRRDRPRDLGDVRVSTDGRLRGAILDEHGDPATFDRVFVQPDWPEGLTIDIDDTEEGCRRIHADHAGRFEIAGLGRGPYRIAAVTDTTRPAVLSLTASPDPEPVTVHLTAAPTIRGTVVGPDGKPAPGVIVHTHELAALEDPLATPKDLRSFRLYGGGAITDADGRFTVTCYSQATQLVGAVRRTPDGLAFGRAWSVHPGAREVRIVLTR